MFLTLLVFLGSGFVPAATMPAGLAAVRPLPALHAGDRDAAGLLTGTPIGTNAIAAIAWSVGIAFVSYVWALHLYHHRRSA